MTRKISGEKVSALPSGKPPERRQLEGTLVLLEPLEPNRHSKSLYAASHENDEARRIWTFLPDGPFGPRGQTKQPRGQTKQNQGVKS